jgi:4-hydroxy-tetrahydrodipicolinate synthase
MTEEREGTAAGHDETLDRLHGVGVALVTIFGTGDEPDVAATAARAQACVARGLSSVLVAGTTGEAWRLSVDARIALAGGVKDAVGDVPVIVGTGDPDGASALAATAKVAAAGVADALLVYAPHGDDPAPFFARVLEEAGVLPVLAYHNPQLPAAAEIDPALVPLLGVAGIKDSSADTNRLATLVEAGARVYVGSATQVALAGACGADGALLAVANVAPSLCVAAWHGDMSAQRKLFALHLRATAAFPGYLKSLPPDAA